MPLGLPRFVRQPFRPIFANDVAFTRSADGAITIDIDGMFLLTKGSAAAMTIAAPGARNVGRKITIVSGSAFAHVVTFTGGTLENGVTGGAKTTWTSAAFVGSTLRVFAISPTRWAVLNLNLGSFA